MIAIWSRGPKFHDLLTDQYDREYDHPLIWSRLALEGRNQYDRNMIEKYAFPQNVYMAWRVLRDIGGARLVSLLFLHHFHRKNATARLYSDISVTKLTGVASQ